MSTVLRTEVVAHRSSRKLAEKYIASFADAIGETRVHHNHERIPATITWEPVKAATGGYDVVSTVTTREEAPETNVWGTLKSDINADEYCSDCEREVPFHYDNCPTRKA